MAQGMRAQIWLLIGVSAIVCYVVIASGRISLRALRATDLPIAAAWPLGVTVSSIALYGLIAIFPVHWAFSSWAAIVIITDIAITLRAKPEPSFDFLDIIGFAFCIAVAAVWCRHIAAAPTVLAHDGLLPAWSDYFIHAGTISHFGDPRAADSGSIWLSGFPAYPYHYASYMIPALFAMPLDQPGLPLATSVWLPVGFLSLAAAAYVLGTSLAGNAGGIAALASLFLFPDASNYGLRNGFFGFHWNLLAIPSATFGLGSALLAVVFLHRWASLGMNRAILASAALVAATILLRVHVFVLLFPAWLATIAASSQSLWRWRWVGGAVLAVFAFVAAVLYRIGAEIPSLGWWQDGPALAQFLDFVHRKQEPTGYTGLYQSIVDGYGEAFGLAAGVLLVFPVCLGAFALLYPAAVLLQRGRVPLGGVDAFPVAVIVCYGLVMLLVPAPYLAVTEFTHRPFVLLYAVIGVWTAALLVRWLGTQGAHGSTRVRQTLMAATALTLPAVWIGAADMSRTRPVWANRLSPLHVERGLIEAASFVRDRAKPGDSMARLGADGGNASNDMTSVLVALTGTPAYVAHPLFHLYRSKVRWEVASGRYAALKSVAAERNPEAALEHLRKLGVRWYIVTSPAGPPWDPARAKAAYESGNVAVYEIAR